MLRKHLERVGGRSLGGVPELRAHDLRQLLLELVVVRLAAGTPCSWRPSMPQGTVLTTVVVLGSRAGTSACATLGVPGGARIMQHLHAKADV